MTGIVVALIGGLVAAGVYLMLRRRAFTVALGLLLLGHAANLTLLVMGRLRLDRPPILDGRGGYTDPLVQAFILTAIVIGFGVTALLLVLVYRRARAKGDELADWPEGDEQR